MKKHIDNPELVEMIEKAKERASLKIQQIKQPARPSAKPNPYANKLNDLLPGNAHGVIVKSSTPGSEKHFRICVDDSGVISAVEVTE